MKKLLQALGAFVLILSASPADASVPGLEFTVTGCEEHSDSVARLYTAGLGRTTEKAGFEWWLGEYQAGRHTLPTMSDFFVASPEFEATYGDLSDQEFVEQVYRNVLGREGEEGGVEFWTTSLALGDSRGDILLRFSESTENIQRSGTSQPALGPFNQGLLEPWECQSVAPPVNPGDTKNCGDFATQAEAQAWFDLHFPAHGDVAKLDQDNNGIPCESLP